ncbi:TPR-REGION domain-containing protein [Mycena kentingensis (nom. inval.)]|nr:TPR-REGION domain-containing protein [Mycena kentingensis (nom. inval.)]
MADQLRAEGNTLFHSKKYAQAEKKYTAALSIDPVNAILLANRAACYNALGRPLKGREDAKKATEIDPEYSKAWFRLAASEDALRNLAECIEAYQCAFSTTQVESQRSEIRKAILAAQDKISNHEYWSVDVLKGMVRAYDLHLPLTAYETRKSLYQAVSRHPDFGDKSRIKVHLLYFPQSESESLQHLELDSGPDLHKEVARLLGCSLVDAVILHSHDRVAYKQNKQFGVGIGRVHDMYELWMDDGAVYKRPLNERASRMLLRPKTYGPVLLQKTSFYKTRGEETVEDHSRDLLSFDKVTEVELASEEYKNRREEWVRLMGTDDEFNFSLFAAQTGLEKK